VLACGGPFVSLLDVTIVNLAVPALAADFRGASLSDLTWVITSYAIVFAALLAPLGRLADGVGRRNLYAVGLGVFTIASAGCALAPSLGWLLVARTAQGIGAAALVPTSLAIVLGEVAPEARTRAIGAWAASASLAAALGPSIGGVLVETLGWRSIFLINVPIGVGLAVVFGAASAERQSGELPDLVGSALLAGGIGGVVLGISKGNDWGWSATSTVLSIGAGLTLLGAAVLRSWQHPRPGLEVGLWRNPTYAAANLVSVFFGLMLYPWLLLGILFLTDVWHYSELQAGVAMTHGAIASAVTGVVVSRRSLSPRTCVVVGSLILAATAWVMAAVLPEDPAFLALWIPTGITCGIGIGMSSTGVSAAAAMSAPAEKFASSTGLNLTARQIGGAVGIALLAALLTHDLGTSLEDYSAAYVMCGAAALLAGVAGGGLRTGTKMAHR
jgi:EmrB/QacA subfamily drug resistance transporter